MTLLPLLIIIRNLFHGILMVEERTGGMAWGSVLRVLAIAGLAQGLAPAELLTPSTAAWTLLAGFAAETVVVAHQALRPRALAP
jgi:hydrogenase/urease accessory protein HupE